MTLIQVDTMVRAYAQWKQVDETEAVTQMELVGDPEAVITMCCYDPAYKRCADAQRALEGHRVGYGDAASLWRFARD